MKVVDKRNSVNQIAYSELEMYKFYEYYYEKDVDGLFMRVPGGLLELMNSSVVNESSILHWSGSFVEVECELHIIK